MNSPVQRSMPVLQGAGLETGAVGAVDELDIEAGLAKLLPRARGRWQ